MKIALVYDHVNKIGGAERILTALHELYPNAPLYTAVYDSKRAQWAHVFDVKTSFLQKLPFAKTYHELYPSLPILAWEQFSFTDFDVVISVTSAEAKGIIVGPQTLHICYLLTPTRYLWSHYDVYFKNVWLKLFSAPLISILRLWDQMAAIRPDKLITISQTSAGRIQKYYRRNAQVIYPPVDIDKFKVHPFAKSRTRSSKFKVEKENYFLIVSRLVSYKRVDIAIQACNRLKLPLKIVGEGLDRKRLEKLAGSTIEFLGNLTDEELIDYYQDCRALLFPQDEDFGLSAVEALSCGRPVIAFAKGGAREIISPGRNGELFYPQTRDALVKILKKFENKVYSKAVCRKEAECFSKRLFKQKFDTYIKEAWQRFETGLI